MTETGPGRLTLPDMGALAARVRITDDGRATALLLNNPSRPLLGGATVTLDLPTPRGLLHVAAHVAEAPVGVEVELDLHGEPELIQRRENVRVAAFVPVLIDGVPPGCAAVDTRTLDIGGGGALVAHLGRFEIGSQVEVTLHCADDAAPITSRAIVVRDAGQGRRGLRFEGMAGKERDRLVRFVFERERLARAITRDP